MNAKGKRSKSKARLANYDKLLSETPSEKEAKFGVKEVMRNFHLLCLSDCNPNRIEFERWDRERKNHDRIAISQWRPKD